MLKPLCPIPFIKYFTTIFLLAWILFNACAYSPRYTRANGHSSFQKSKSVQMHRVANVSTAPDSFSQIGIASYYSNKFIGRKTASGELYVKENYTAAHRSLPFNTLVKVTNVENNRSVVVRINDRGPVSKTRVIDVSRVAASELGIIRKGLGKVKIELVE